MRLVTAALLVVAIAGCAGSEQGSAMDRAGLTYLDVFTGYDAALAEVDGRGPTVCAEPFGTWFPDWGVRGAACVAAQIAPPAELIGRAPTAPFRSGPHAVGETVRLDLDAARSFGRYDPAFVRWIGEAAVPTGPTAAVVRPAYQRHFARTARLFWLARRDLARGGFPDAVPAGAPADYAAFLDGGPVPEGAESYDLDADPNGGFSVFAFTDRSEALLADLDMTLSNDWTGKYEGNVGYGFWLRRRADGTEAGWADALERLLRTFDADWMAEHR